jgi:hypothetical protein
MHRGRARRGRFQISEFALKRINPRPLSRAHAICTGPYARRYTRKAPSPTRWNTASGSVGGICLRTTLSKDSVRVSHLCVLAGGSSVLARGKRDDQPEHDQSSSCRYNFLSHEALPVLIDRNENMLAVPVCPIPSVMMPISIMVMMPVWMVPVVFLYYHGRSLSGERSSD